MNKTPQNLNKNNYKSYRKPQKVTTTIKELHKTKTTSKTRQKATTGCNKLQTTLKNQYKNYNNLRFLHFPLGFPRFS